MPAMRLWGFACLVIASVSSGAKAQPYVPIADVGTQWSVEALFDHDGPGGFFACQATSAPDARVGEWTITELPNGQIHLAGGYEDSPPEEERGEVELRFVSGDGDMLGIEKTAGAFGANRFGAILLADPAMRQRLSETVTLIVMANGKILRLETRQMRQLGIVLQSCVEHYAAPGWQGPAGSDADLAALSALVSPRLGAGHSLVAKDDIPEDTRPAALQAGPWLIMPWHNEAGQAMEACAANTKDGAGRVWSLVITPDLFAQLSIDRPGRSGRPAYSTVPAEIRFEGVKQGNRFYRGGDAVAFINPRIEGHGDVGPDYVRMGFSFDTFAQSGFLNGKSVRVLAGRMAYELPLEKLDLALYGIFQCLRENFTPEGVVWPRDLTPAETQSVVAELVRTRPEKVAAAVRLQSVEPAMNFVWQDLTGHMAVFDPVHAPGPARRIDKARTNALQSCFKVRRDQTLDMDGEATGFLLECNVKGFMTYRAEIAAARGGTGAHLVLEMHGTHAVHKDMYAGRKDMSLEFRQLVSRAQKVLTEFVANRPEAPR